MAEYIERSAILKKQTTMTEYDEGGWASESKVVRVEDIESIPAADVAPVVHGRWEYHDCVCTGDGLAAVYACSNCRFCIDEEVFEQLNATDFCNCCGARMDGDNP